MHTDVRYRGSLAVDLMEPVRHVADELVLDLLEDRELGRGDVLETPRGVCRLGPELARILSEQSPILQAAIAPIAENLTRALLP